MKREGNWRPRQVISDDEPIIKYLVAKVASQEQTIRLLCKRMLEK
jgi:hypothetical protein